VGEPAEEAEARKHALDYLEKHQDRTLAAASDRVFHVVANKHNAAEDGYKNNNEN